MDNKDLYDIVMESERKANLMHIEQDNREREQFGNKDYLDVAIEAGKKFNSEYKGKFDASTLEKIKSLYNIQDDETAQRIINLKSIIKQTKQQSMTIDELIIFLNDAMNYDEMQIWLMRQKIKGVELSLNEKLKKFFDLNSDEEILKIYDIQQNYDENNITGIRKVLTKTSQKKI